MGEPTKRAAMFGGILLACLGFWVLVVWVVARWLT